MTNGYAISFHLSKFMPLSFKNMYLQIYCCWRKYAFRKMSQSHIKGSEAPILNKYGSHLLQEFSIRLRRLLMSLFRGTFCRKFSAYRMDLLWHQQLWLNYCKKKRLTFRFHVVESDTDRLKRLRLRMQHGSDDQ